jgi:hypothetical protein
MRVYCRWCIEVELYYDWGSDVVMHVYSVFV